MHQWGKEERDFDSWFGPIELRRFVFFFTPGNVVGVSHFVPWKKDDCVPVVLDEVPDDLHDMGSATQKG